MTFSVDYLMPEVVHLTVQISKKNLSPALLKIGITTNSCRNIFLSHGRPDPRFKLWIEKGRTSLSGIIQEDEIMSFQSLKEKFSLEKEDFYLQLRNYHSQNMKRKSQREDSKAFIQLFTKAYKSEIKTNIISQVYKSLQDLNNYSTRYIKDEWEKEGGLTVTDEEWLNICHLQRKNTKSHSWKEFCWKNVTPFL